jgi:hypothetical protein
MRLKPIPKLTENDLARFWAKVDKGVECWEWLSCKNKDGYGQFKLNGSTYSVHRISYAIVNRDPRELCVCHSCDNPSCVNPEHLWAGTDRDNAIDRNAKERQARGEGQGFAKLTERDIKEILESDKSQLILAEQYGAVKSAISGIKRGKKWKHIEGERHIGNANTNSQTGVKNISPKGNRYQAQIRIEGKCCYLGIFNTIKEAETVVIAKRREMIC